MADDDDTRDPAVIYGGVAPAPIPIASECPLCGEWAQTIEVDYLAEGPTITRYIYSHPDGRVCNAPVS